MALPHVPHAIAACRIRLSHCYVWLHFVFATVLKLELHIDLADNYPNPGLFERLISTCPFTCPGVSGGTPGTHRVEDHSEEELATSDALVQLPGASRVVLVENGVREEPAGLSRQNLGETGASQGKVPSKRECADAQLHVCPPHGRWHTSCVTGAVLN